ncbi:MAG: N-acetyl-gamma-glutamyl-phosphate reductase [Gammaproteobacteria bacterium]
MLEVGIVGATGYTGSELLRLLVLHPQVRVRVVTSRSEAGTKVQDMFANLRGYLDIEFTVPSLEDLAQCDLVFFATPNGTAMKMVPDLLSAGVRVIDLAADFRIRDEATWSHWYGMEHACPELLAEAVYGLPELNRERIADARLVANPGCYPTAVTLGLLPLVESKVVNPSSIIADCKSGVSGAGRKAAVGSLMSEMGESFKAYAASGHRHWPEIRQTLRSIVGDSADLLFVPHLVPMIRGIHATVYAELIAPDADMQELFERRYADEPFVDVLPGGTHPETRSVKGSNMCRIALHRPGGGKRLIVLSVIDNLVKGAAGQAIQNMNIMLGLDESTGLGLVALQP